MRYLSRVVWSEGMYLAPHHFQTQGRYFEDSMRFAIEQAWFEPWGLVHYRLDEDAIKNGIVSVQSAHGIFEDGLVFAMPECDPLPAKRDIREIFLPLEESLVVSLAISERNPTLATCDLNGEASNARYRAAERKVRDGNDGITEKKVKFCEKNIRLLGEPEIGEDMLSIPLARVKRDNSGHMIYDPEFIPPCTRLTASERLMTIIERMIEALEEKSSVLVRPHGKPGGFQAGVSQADISNFWFLHTVNSFLPLLRHFHRAKPAHPEELFREMSRMAGALCTFSLESNAAALPLYDHRRLDRCFHELSRHILDHLEILVHSNTIEVPIRLSAPNLYTGEINDQRCFGRSRWVLGIGSPAGEARVLTLGTTLIKMCSSRFVTELVRRAVPGLELMHLPAPPPAISARPDMQYFGVNKAGPCWNHIVETRKVGIYIPNDLPEANVELHVILES